MSESKFQEDSPRGLEFGTRKTMDEKICEIDGF